MKKTIVAYMLVAAALQASAQVKTVVSEFRQAGPIRIFQALGLIVTMKLFEIRERTE